MADIAPVAPAGPVQKTLQAHGLERPASLREQMERSTSEGIREEGQELTEAARQSLNVVVDLSLDGIIRWVSPTWPDVVGTDADAVQGKPIADILVDSPDTFAEATEALRHNDSGSKVIRFSVYTGPKSRFAGMDDAEDEADETPRPDEAQDTPSVDEPKVLNLEAQGIMVYDRKAGVEDHTMWMIRPAIQIEVTIDLPPILVESLGVGAEVLAQHLTIIADAGNKDLESHPPAIPVLCRICERQITPWWFPKHTELCLQEHRVEADLALAHDNLSEHRNKIVKVLDALEARSRHQKSSPADHGAQTPPHAEYNGMHIGSATSSGNSSSNNSRSPSISRSADRLEVGRHHHRQRSFTVRRPPARIVELVLDLCDTALEISTPALKESRTSEGELRSQSPQSEGRISQVLQWQSPSAGALENEPGLAALCDDTTVVSKAKVDAVMRYRQILEYSERIRSEFTALVQECIDAALDKASRIAAGESASESSDESTSKGDNTEGEATQEEDNGHRGLLPPPPIEAPSAMSLAMRSAHNSPSGTRRRMSIAMSDPPSSAHRTSASRARTPMSATHPPEARSSWVSTDTDPGLDSDSSMRSSVRSQPNRTQSPASDMALSRGPSSRERKRKSLVLPRAMSASRAHSPARPPTAPLSPLRVAKPRLPSGSYEGTKSPLMSPTLSSSEFCSPTWPLHHAQQLHRRQSSAASSEISRAPASPNLTMSNAPQPRAAPPSIKDFEIIKPISKGAFGSVYLAKKKSTGDYYAIKALKKADMVSKNQVANVKAERAILMWQGESDFVAKLYWTFPSKDYIFLVMEYLNGGDCASLVKALGTLPEDWAKRYLAEVVQGVEHLHSREIVHRDLKPDNLLIDQKGHLKLTDFGLSRMGLIGRQKRALNSKPDSLQPDPLKQSHFARSASITSSRSTSIDAHTGPSPGSTPALTPMHGDVPSYFSLTRESSLREPTRKNSGQHSEAGDSDQLHTALRRMSLYDDSWGLSRQSPQGDDLKEEAEHPDGHGLRHTDSNHSNRNSTLSQPGGSMLPPPMALFDPDDSNRRFVGTPDYLAPETINGFGQDEMSDWWSIGCILFEFLFGYPPFHADSPDKVFDNILSRRIDWPNDDMGVSAQAKDLMSRLMTVDARERLGSNKDDKFENGGAEIRNHPWFRDIDWASLTETEASFIPQPENPEDTEYFDSRGASHQDFATEFDDQNSSPALTPGGSELPERPHDALTRARSNVHSMKRNLMPLHIPKHVREGRNRRMSEPAADDFGQFSFKNLGVLEKANKDVIQKLRAEAMQAQSRPPQHQHQSRQSVSGSPPTLEGSPTLTMPPARFPAAGRGGSPTTQNLAVSSPNRGSQPNSPLVQFSASGLNHERRKTSSGSSQSAGSLPPVNTLEMPRAPTTLKQSTTGSPTRPPKSPGPMDLEGSAADRLSVQQGSPRTRSHTVGSKEGSEGFRLPHHQKHRSQVLDVSPSSSDNETSRQKALLRVQRRRQSSRRLSQINLSDGPVFRPLDVLVCEDHPVSKMVMEKLLGKLRCRTIVASNGAEAMQYAMSSVKFDIIFMEFKLPQINGADVARMLHDTKNTNSLTPIVAVTGYLKELQAPHHFEALVDKPPNESKLVEVLSTLCQWKPPPPGWIPPPLSVGAGSFHPSSLRNESMHTDDSPTSTTSGFNTGQSGSYIGSGREDSVSSVSALTDPDQRNDDTMSMSSRPSGDKHLHDSRFGISPQSSNEMPRGALHTIAALKHSDSAPAEVDLREVRKQPSAELIEAKRKAMERERFGGGGELGDDEDEELGRRARSRSPRLKEPPSKSKLSVEMLRTDSQQSVASVVRAPSTASAMGLSSSPARDNDFEHEAHLSATTPPIKFPLRPGHDSVDISVDQADNPLVTGTTDGKQIPIMGDGQAKGRDTAAEAVMFSISPPD